MKILVLPPSDYLGHPNPCRIHHIFERFPLFGDDIYVVRFSLYDDIIRGSNVTVLSIGDIKFDSLSVYYLMNTGTFWKSIREIIDEFRIDTVLFANLYPPFVASKRLPRRILSVVDMVDHYPVVAAENLPGFLPKRIGRHLFESMMKSIIVRCDSVVACSYQLADYARQNGGRDVHRIPNGVEDYFFLDYEDDAIGIRQKFGVKDSEIVMCFVGNIEYWLEMNQLLLAIKLAKKKVRRAIKLFLVGGKLRTDYINRIEDQVKELGLNENVIRVGFVPHNEVPKYVAASDICVIPKNPLDPVSYYSSPVKLWEYLAQGKPVISTPIPEVLRCASEYVSIANTHNDYLTHIAAFADNPSYFIERAMEGRKTAKKHTWTEISKTYNDLLSTISK